MISQNHQPACQAVVVHFVGVVVGLVGTTARNREGKRELRARFTLYNRNEKRSTTNVEIV